MDELPGPPFIQMDRGAFSGSCLASKNQKKVLISKSCSWPTPSSVPGGRWICPAYDLTPGVVSQMPGLGLVSVVPMTYFGDHSTHCFVPNLDTFVELGLEDRDSLWLRRELRQRRLGQRRRIGKNREKKSHTVRLVRSLLSISPSHSLDWLDSRR